MTKVFTKEEIYDEVVRVMGESFDVDTASVSRDSRLMEDLDFDSIDAVDMIVHMQNMIGQRVKPDDFKNVRTVGDIVDVLAEISARGETQEAK